MIPNPQSYPFGWEPNADGFRGHIFVSTDNSTVIVAIKGTSALWLVGDGGPTVKKDKLNDNLLFSCCCAKVGPTWTPVCKCHSGGYTCDQRCLEKSLVEDSLFYPVGLDLYNNVTYLYPKANVWVIGHSLGGALASLVGITFGAPVVAFEAPGEKLAAARLHINLPVSDPHACLHPPRSLVICFSSRPLNISRTSTTPETLFLWGFATVSVLPVPWEATPLRVNATWETSSSTTP